MLVDAPQRVPFLRLFINVKLRFHESLRTCGMHKSVPCDGTPGELVSRRRATFVRPFGAPFSEKESTLLSMAPLYRKRLFREVLNKLPSYLHRTALL